MTKRVKRIDVWVDTIDCPSEIFYSELLKTYSETKELIDKGTIDHIHTTQTIFGSYMYADAVYFHINGDVKTIPFCEDTYGFNGSRNFLLYINDTIPPITLDSDISTNWAELYRQIDMVIRYNDEELSENIRKLGWDLMDELEKLRPSMSHLNGIFEKVGVKSLRDLLLGGDDILTTLKNDIEEK